MQNFTNRFSFSIALFICFTLIAACGSKKETTTEKEEVKTETKKETTKNETSSTSGNQLYFVEEYKDGEEVGKSEKFFINSKGGYITAMLKTSVPIGVGSVDVRLERETLDGSEIIDTQPYDVSPDKDYFFFDKITFYKSGDYKVTVFKKDGTVMATGKVRIEFN